MIKSWRTFILPEADLSEDDQIPEIKIWSKNGVNETKINMYLTYLPVYRNHLFSTVFIKNVFQTSQAKTFDFPPITAHTSIVSYTDKI